MRLVDIVRNHQRGKDQRQQGHRHNQPLVPSPSRSSSCPPLVVDCFVFASERQHPAPVRHGETRAPGIASQLRHIDDLRGTDSFAIKTRVDDAGVDAERETTSHGRRVAVVWFRLGVFKRDRQNGRLFLVLHMTRC